MVVVEAAGVEIVVVTFAAVAMAAAVIVQSSGLASASGPAYSARALPSTVFAKLETCQLGVLY